MKDFLSKKPIYLVASMVVVLILPLVIQHQYIIHLIILSAVTAILAVSWNLLSGYLGVFSFGHPAFFGIGAYVSALLSMHVGISPWLAMGIGALGAAMFSIVVAFPVLRLQGAYVAVVTLAFMIILERICYNWISLTNGPMGLFGIPPLTNFTVLGYTVDFEGINRVPYYYVIMGLLFITMVVVYRIVHSSLGLHLMAIRESEEAASAMGVKIYRNKIMVFAISSFFAGLAGAFYAHYILVISPSVFAFFLMATILSATLIGGWGTFYGPVVGAFILGFLADYLKDIGDIHHFFYGAFLIVMIIFLPKGLVESIKKKMFALMNTDNRGQPW